MTHIEYRTGDLFQAAEGDADALAHGCNCAGAMGRGIAVEFKRRWPEMYEEYRRQCKDGRFNLGGVLPWGTPEGLVVYNLGTQAHWRTRAQLTAVGSAVSAMLDHATANGIRRIAMPRIAAGLGGLDWADVEQVINDALKGTDIRITVYELAAT